MGAYIDVVGGSKAGQPRTNSLPVGKAERNYICTETKPSVLSHAPVTRQLTCLAVP